MADAVSIPEPASENVAETNTSEPVVEWASGTVESATRTAVAARIVARIEQIHVAAGDARTRRLPGLL